MFRNLRERFGIEDQDYQVENPSQDTTMIVEKWREMYYTTKAAFSLPLWVELFIDPAHICMSLCGICMCQVVHPPLHAHLLNALIWETCNIIQECF